MGLLDRLFGRQPSGSRSRDDLALADRLAMETMSRVLPPGAQGGGTSAPLRREVVYLLGAICFKVLATHPRIGEESQQPFFECYLEFLDAHGKEAGLWPDLGSPFLNMFFPDRLERYRPLLDTADSTDPDSRAAALAAASGALLEDLGSDISAPPGLAEGLVSLGNTHWDGTLDLLDA
jgi:hypothetical protein